MRFNRDRQDRSNIRSAKAEAKQEEKYWSKIDAEEQLEEDACVKDNNESCAIVEEAIRANREEATKLEDQYVMLEKQYKMYARVGPEYTIFVEESINTNRAEAAALEDEYEILVVKYVKLTNESMIVM